jgi:polyisoprenyl-phosphate glycosyltransferase
MPSEIKSLSFIVPCLNEEENISEFVKRIQPLQSQKPSIEYEIIFVDDGSQDKTLAILRELSQTHNHIHYVSLTRNFGSHLAMLAGVDHCQTDAAVFIPVDLQNDPALVNTMLEHSHNGAEIVIGQCKKGTTGFLTRWLASTFYYIFDLVSNIKLPSGGTDFILITQRPIQFLRKNREYDVNIFMLLLWPGFKSATFEYLEGKRHRGKSKWTMSKKINLAVDSFFGFSSAPLKLITRTGIVLASGSFLFVLYIVVETMVLGTPVPGFPTLAATTTFGFGITFLALGIISEYLSQVLSFVRGRPLYLTSETNQSEFKSKEKQ